MQAPAVDPLRSRPGVHLSSVPWRKDFAILLLFLRVIEIASHRNGVGGWPFDVVLFEDGGEHGSLKVGIVFEEPAGQCAVLDVGKLAAGDVRFGENSWRGDVYEKALREVIRRRFGTN